MEKDFIIKEILEDIYKIDPSLKNEEEKVMRVIKEMIDNKPELEPDENFVKSLRGLLSEEIKKEKASSCDKNKFIGEKFYKRALFPAFATVFVLLIVFVSVLQEETGYLKIDKTQNSINEFSDINIDAIEQDNAFGFLGDVLNGRESVSFEENLEGDTDSTKSQSLDAVGGGGFYTESTNSAIEPFVSNYRYVYQGEDFSLEKDKMEVLKKVADGNYGDKIADFLNTAGFNSVDFSDFDNLKIKNFTIYQDEPFGYQINLDLYRGDVYLYKNWEKWPESTESCYESSCLKTSRLKVSDLPENEIIVSKTKDFLNSLKINLSDYGEPVINRDSAIFEENGTSYVADDVIVLYPLLINNMNVYESYGELYGIKVGYDVRNDKISMVNGLSLQRYQSSLYDIETDFDSIVNNMEDYSIFRGNSSEYGEIILNTPKIGYVRYQRYYNQHEEEYLVPALVFPVDASSSYYRDNVVVSLIEGLNFSYNSDFLEESIKIEE